MKGAKRTPTQEIRAIFETYGHEYCSKITEIPRTTIQTWAERYGWNKPSSNEVKTVMVELIKQKIQKI
ncbi:TPA: hypothetical protein ACX6QM_001191 [Photobacterium damselae]